MPSSKDGYWTAVDFVAIATSSLQERENLGESVLSFNCGELFQITFSSLDWFYGKSFIFGTKGLIPKNFVFVLSKETNRVEYECITEDVKIEMFVAIFQWTERLKLQLSQNPHLLKSGQKIAGKLMSSQEAMAKVKSTLGEFLRCNERIIYRTDRYNILNKIDALNKEFKLAKKFRATNGVLLNLRDVLAVNICDTADKSSEKHRMLQKASSIESTGNISYQLIVNMKGLQFTMEKILAEVPLSYVFALCELDSCEYLSEPVVIRRNIIKNSDGEEVFEDNDREITFSFNCDWLRKQLKQAGIDESRMRTDVLSFVGIVCWIVTSTADVMCSRRTPMPLNMPNFQVPMYSALNHANISLPFNLAVNQKMNTKVPLTEITIDTSGKMDTVRYRSYSLGNDLGSNNITRDITIPLSSKKKQYTAGVSRLSTDSSSEPCDLTLDGFEESNATMPLVEGDKMTPTKLSLTIYPSNVTESKHFAKGSVKYVVSNVHLAYNASSSADTQSPKPSVKFLAYMNCPNWSFDSFESIIEPAGNSSSRKGNTNYFNVLTNLAPFLNRFHVLIDLLGEEEVQKWKRMQPYLFFELRRTKITTEQKDLLTKLCVVKDSVDNIKLLGYCVFPLFDDVLPRNGDYNLKILNPNQLREILQTRSRNAQNAQWNFSSWAYESTNDDDTNNTRLSLFINFSLSSQLLMNEAFVPQLLRLPNTISSLLSQRDFIEAHELDKSLNAIRNFLASHNTDRKRNIEVCLRFMKDMVAALLESILIVYSKMLDNKDLLEVLIELLIDLCWAVQRETSSKSFYTIQKGTSNDPLSLSGTLNGVGFSLERCLLEASKKFFQSKSQTVHDAHLMSSSLMTSLKHEIKFNITRLNASDGHGSVVSTGGSFSAVDTLDELDDGSNEFISTPRSHRRRQLESKITFMRNAKSRVSHNLQRRTKNLSVDGSPDGGSCSEGLNFAVVAPVKTNEILELTPLFLKTAIVHFKQASKNLSQQSHQEFVEIFEEILQSLFEFLNLRKVSAFYETVALGLIHILDSITDLNCDEMIHTTFEVLGDLLNASACGSFAQRKNPCIFLMNKMEQHADPKLWKLSVHFIFKTIKEERARLDRDDSTDPDFSHCKYSVRPSDKTYETIVILLSQLLSFLSDARFSPHQIQSTVLDSLMIGSQEKESFISWFFGDVVESCAKDRTNTDSARAYFGIGISIMELLTSCDAQTLRTYFPRDQSITAESWNVIDSLIELARRTQDERLDAKFKKNSMASFSPFSERRLTNLRDNPFGKKLFESEEHFYFKIKATHVLLSFIEQIVITLDVTSLNLARLGSYCLQTISQNFLQPSYKDELHVDFMFPQTKQSFGDLRAFGVAVFQKIWLKALQMKHLSDASKVASQQSSKMVDLAEEQNFSYFLDLCCCDLVRLCILMDKAITDPFCKIILEMLLEERDSVEVHIIGTLIQFDLQNGFNQRQFSVRTLFYDRLDVSLVPVTKRRDLEVFKNRLKTMLERQEFSFQNCDSTEVSPRSILLGSTLRLSFLIKFYSTADQTQYRLFQELYLRQLIEVLQDVDQWRDFYKQEVAQCYLKLAEVCGPETPTKSDPFFNEKYYELIEKAAVNFNEAGCLVQAEKLFRELETAYRNAWMVRKLLLIREQLDEIYNCLTHGNYTDKGVAVADLSNYYCVKFYGNLPLAMKDQQLILRSPLDTDIARAAYEICKIFPQIHKQPFGTPTDMLDPNDDKAYFQIIKATVKSEGETVDKEVDSDNNGYRPAKQKEKLKKTSRFYAKSKTEGDELFISIEPTFSKLVNTSEAAVFMTKRGKLVDSENRLEQSEIWQDIYVHSPFPIICPWNSVKEIHETEVTGLEKAMSVVKASLEELDTFARLESLTSPTLNTIRDKIQQLICSPVQGGMQSYRSAFDDDYVKKFPRKQVEEFRHAARNLVDKITELLTRRDWKRDPTRDEIFGEYLFETRCCFKHISHVFDNELVENVFWFIGQKLALAPLTEKCTSAAVPGRNESQQRKFMKVMRSLESFLQTFMLKNFHRLLQIKKVCLTKSLQTNLDAKEQLELLQLALSSTVHKFNSAASSGVGSFAHSFPMFAQEMEWSEQDKENFFENVQILAAKD